ncbi:SDR family NAD(P)-dependent oxidoreductase [Variovorax sp. KK3]|uniref:SDR family NAD(P)-dependent oxidoreductase n=1 Tax=Variovorax sp. KK3 TaxID=1855728 RepID=UPI00097BBB3E|nr:SDR family oxidoreductase [Variovorax sp. KK3]
MSGALHADLAGLSVAVTGGTKGIGRAAVTTLAANGARVVFQGSDEAAGREIEDQCRKWDGEAVFVRGDLMRFEDAQALVAVARERHGRLDVYVSSGGPREPRPVLFHEMETPAHSFAMLQSRLIPRLNGLHAAVPLMREQGSGKIVLLTTDAARTPTPSESMVGAAGAAIIALTRSLAKELARDGIRINAVATTITAGTPPYDAYVAAKAANRDDTLVKAFSKAHAQVGLRINTAQDLADYILFLASPASDQITGSTMSINGGLSFPSY